MSNLNIKTEVVRDSAISEDSLLELQLIANKETYEKIRKIRVRHSELVGDVYRNLGGGIENFIKEGFERVQDSEIYANSRYSWVLLKKFKWKLYNDYHCERKEF